MFLAVFAVKQILHGLAAGFVLFARAAAIAGIHAALGFGLLGLSAVRAAVGKARFPRLEFELFSASNTGFDRVSHRDNYFTMRQKRKMTPATHIVISHTKYHKSVSPNVPRPFYPREPAAP